VANLDDPSLATDDQEKPKRSKTGLIIKLAVVTAILAACAGGGAWYWLSASDTESGDKSPPKTATIPAPALYFAIDPAFVVNLNGSDDGPRYLQLEVQLMTRDPIALKQLENNAPAIRARLLLLFSQVQTEQINQRASIEKLQADALAEVHKLMLAETGSKCADSLLFTSFVTQ
jgi:flagellar FliL protein